LKSTRGEEKEKGKENLALGFDESKDGESLSK